MSKSRQLAAIMFTDIVGFTALMGSDEEKTWEILEKNRQIHKPIITEFNGRWIKELGDGVMATFPTVSDAVNAATKIMQACDAANQYQLSMGIHSAEVIFENGDVFGDGVNIAARIESAAPPGCILVSESVHRNIVNKKDVQTHFVKETELKNVSHPIRLYQVLTDNGKLSKSEDKIVSLVENSIAVLPFVNMSSDPEQEYFSDGISEEIINMLAQEAGIKVIGRTSSFAFKGKNMDLKLIGDQLKVSHILEGSVRKSGNKLRITAQLIKVDDGFHMYSEKFDRELEDIFDIQDEISLAILKATKSILFGLDKEPVLKKYTDNVEAYQLYLKSRFYYNQYTPDATVKAVGYLEEAIKMEPQYAIAYSSLSFCYLTIWYWGWLPPEQCLPGMLKSAQKAIELDDQIAESYLALGRIKLFYEYNLKEAQNKFKKALAINPNSAECHIQLGWCATHLGNHSEAQEHAKIADSLDPFSLMNLYLITVIHWTAGDLDQLKKYSKRMIDIEPNFYAAHQCFGWVYDLSENYEEALASQKLSNKLNYDTLTLTHLGFAYGRLGEISKGREIIEKLKNLEGIEKIGNNFIGQVHMAIGELDTGFSYLDKAIENREPHMLFVKYILRDLGLLEDPRTKAMLDKMGVPL
jgi:TolB-like protein